MSGWTTRDWARRRVRTPDYDRRQAERWRTLTESRFETETETEEEERAGSTGDEEAGR